MNQPSAPEPISPATKASLIQKLVADNPLPAAPVGANAAAVAAPPVGANAAAAPPVGANAAAAPVGADPPDAPPAEEKKETKSAKAARESKALRAAKEEARALQAQLDKSKAVFETAASYQKAQDLFKTDPKAAIKLLGGDPNLAYQALTDAYLSQDIDLKPKDPVQEKIKEIDPYLETLKKQVEQQNVQLMISNHIAPIISTKKQELECLYGYFDPEGKNPPKQVERAVMQCIFDNGADHFEKQYKGDHNKLLKEHGNYETYFEKVALHLEKQVEQDLDKLVQRVTRLSKFKNRLDTKVEAPAAVSKTETGTPPKPSIPVLETNSTDKPATELSADPNRGNRANRVSNPARRILIDKLLKEQGLE